MQDFLVEMVRETYDANRSLGKAMRQSFGMKQMYEKLIMQIITCIDNVQEK